MIDIKLEDFENYRSRLKRYALGLLNSKGSAHTLYSEYDEKANDIVQECYLAFHNSRTDVFVSDEHLFSFLKICLYKCYQMSVSSKRRQVQYGIFKASNLEDLTENCHPTVEIEDNTFAIGFIDSLNDYQKSIAVKLLSGITITEIAKEYNVSKQAISQSVACIRKNYIKYENTENTSC